MTVTTVYNEGVWRVEVTATKVADEDPVSPIVMVPEGVCDISVYCIASASASGKVEESPSSGVSIQSGTPTPVWMSPDNALDSVGVTMVRSYLGARVPVAFRVSSLTEDETATMILVGRKVGR